MLDENREQVLDSDVSSHCEQIHSSAIIYQKTAYQVPITVEPYAILGIQDRFHPESQLVLGTRAFIGSRCTLYGGVVVGDNFDISDQSTVFYDNQFGQACRIGPKAIIKNGCRFGDNVRVNAAVFMENVEVGSNVFIGPGTVFTDDLHPPCPRRKDCVRKTKVGSHVSIGANVTIAPGVTIGDYCQIYAGSVVTSDVASYSVMAGIPAKRIKHFGDLQCKAGFYKKPFDWWE